MEQSKHLPIPSRAVLLRPSYARVAGVANLALETGNIDCFCSDCDSMASNGLLAVRGLAPVLLSLDLSLLPRGLEPSPSHSGFRICDAEFRE